MLNNFNLYLCCKNKNTFMFRFKKRPDQLSAQSSDSGINIPPVETEFEADSGTPDGMFRRFIIRAEPIPELTNYSRYQYLQFLIPILILGGEEVIMERYRGSRGRGEEAMNDPDIDSEARR